MPGISRDASSITGELLLANADPVGRLELAVLGAFGDDEGWRGARGWATLRRWRPELTLEGFAGQQRSNEVVSQPAVDAAIRGGALRTSLATDRSAWRSAMTGGVAAMRVDGPGVVGGIATRTTGWGEIGASGWQRIAASDVSASVRVRGDAGRHAATGIGHVVATAAVRIDAPFLPAIDASVLHAEAKIDATDVPYELIAIGGNPPVLVDPVMLPQRIAMPALPVGALVGGRALVARTSLGLGVLTPYYWTVRVDDDVFGGWQRVAGIEGRMSTAAIPFLTLPAAELTGGIGYSIDRPYKGRTTLYVDVTYRP